jgi:hypothetical protein
MRLGRRAALLLAPTLLAVACATSENVDVTGAAGSSVAGTSGTAGVTGAAGTAARAGAGGAAGSVGAAGTGPTSGTAGSAAGRAGTTGSAGSAGGRGGTTGSAGSAGGAGRAGTTGSAGRGGTTGSAGRGGSGGGGRAGTGGTTSPDGGTATFTQVYTSVISANCFGSACHNPTGGGRPDFSTKSSCYTFFKNQGQLYPGMDPQKSYIYFIVHGDPSATPPSPPYMPPDPNPKVSADGLAIVAAWIAAGALNN